MTLARGVAPDPVDGDFHGKPTLRIDRGAWIEVLATAGPRIVGLGARGGPNLLAETPGLGWDTPTGRYDLVGGHRLWFAPEDPERVAVPDDGGLQVERLGDGLRLVGATEPVTGVVRAIDVRLDDDRPVVRVRHELWNMGEAALDIAPWAITQLPLGGVVLLPQVRATPGHVVRPNRAVVLWPYASWDDERLAVRDALVSVDARAGEELKVGCLDEQGWVAYVRDGAALVRRFEAVDGATYPDLGCNVETFCGPRYLELEVLGPLRTLHPGTAAVLEEHWEVRPVASPDRLAALDPVDLLTLLAEPLP